MKKLICLLLLMPLLFSGCSKSSDPKKQYEGPFTNIDGYVVTNKSNFAFVYPIKSTCEIKGNTILIKASTNSKSLFEKSITFTEKIGKTGIVSFYQGSEYVGAFNPSNHEGKKDVIVFINNQDTYQGYKVDFTCIYE